MITQYLDQLKENLLQTISQCEISDTSMRSETSNDDMVEDSQRVPYDKILSDKEIEKVENFVQQMTRADKTSKQ